MMTLRKACVFATLFGVAVGAGIVGASILLREYADTLNASFIQSFLLVLGPAVGAAVGIMLYDMLTYVEPRTPPSPGRKRIPAVLFYRAIIGTCT